MKKLLVCIVSLVCMMSCQQSEIAEGKVDSKVLMEFDICVSGCKEASVKSILPSDIDDKVTELTIVSYDENGGLMDVQYLTDVKDVRLYVSGTGKSHIYALANMGDMTHDVPYSENDISNLCYVLESFSKVETSGIPMCGEAVTSVSEQIGTIQLHRLFAKVNLHISHKLLGNNTSQDRYVYNLCNLSAYVRQANRRMFPFAPQGSRAFSSEDVMDVSDYDPNMHDREGTDKVYSEDEMGPGFVQDTTIVLYVPENMQGKLLPANGDYLQKTGPNLENINGKDYSGLCTYIEVTVNKVQDDTGLSGHLGYRLYLGENSYSDFSIEGNMIYDLTLDISPDSFILDNWKVDRSNGWNDRRILRFDKDIYTISPLGKLEVYVHYHRTKGGREDSENRPEDWVYDFDSGTMSMSEAGLRYELSGSLLQSPDRTDDFCFTFTASAMAESGMEFPMVIMTNDGRVSDHAKIRISGNSNDKLEWSFKPEYVAQCGEVTLNDLPEPFGPVIAKTSDASVISVKRVDDDTFYVVGLKTGVAEVIFETNKGVRLYSCSMSIKTPVLKLFDESVVLSPDGSSIQLKYQYVDHSGEALDLKRFDTKAFSSILALYFCEEGFIDMEMKGFNAFMHVSRLWHQGKMVDMETYHHQKIRAVGCEHVDQVNIAAYVTDPFKGMTSMEYGKIDDYSLFSLPGVNKSVYDKFVSKLAECRKYKFYAPAVRAVTSSIKVELVTRWQDGFSFENQVYTVSYSEDSSFPDGMAFTIEQNEITEQTRHGTGPHDIMIHVVNGISGEVMSFNCGSVDVYVHTAIGARAEFAWRYADHVEAGSAAVSSAFADAYNLIAGNQIYPDVSGMRVYYMDVNTEFLTDVSGVQVFERLLSGSLSGENLMDAQSVVCPSVPDGAVNAGLGLMYSVDGTDQMRQNLALEPCGTRRGIGTMLYRALSLKSVSSDYDEAGMLSLFLGVGRNGKASIAYSPCYHVIDVMTGKRVSRYSLWHFAPSQYPDCVDGDGNGYHVVHFLDEICPETAGWINLL